MEKNLPPEVLANVQKWLKPPYDEKTRKEVQNLLDHNPDVLADAFYKTISFGTGGMRGIMGIGTNRLNRYTIGAATQGLANYILKKEKEGSVFISYDSRHHSRLFAEEAARVLAGNGIRVFLTKKLRPTPFVSFGCRHHKCTAAIMITASHNPPEYNGYKVYWSDGAQVVPPHDKGIMEEVQKIADPNQVKLAPFKDPLIQEVGEEDDEAYFEALDPLQNYPEDNQNLGPKLHLIYSPLHGTGITTAPAALKRWGFTSISYVDEQKEPDGSFPSAHSPNPEQEAALKLGIRKLEKEKADLFLATDPDADRMGVVVMHENKPMILNGNQIASICLYYLCTTLSKLGKMPENAAFVTTIVTTGLFKLIVSSFNKTCFEVLTGFKYIGEKIHEWEESSRGYTFIFGAEESLGYLYGTHSRDKDATIAACLIAEIATQQKKAGKTLVDLLHDIYRKFGLFKEKQLSIPFGSGLEAHNQMTKLMENLRKNPPKDICGQDVIIVKDYLTRKKKNLATGKEEPLTLPESDVLLFVLKDESRFIIRPSGTEPKIKIYGMVREPHSTSIEAGLKVCDERLDKRLNFIKERHLST